MEISIPNPVSHIRYWVILSCAPVRETLGLVLALTDF